MKKIILTALATTLLPTLAFAASLKIAVIDTAYVFDNTSAAATARDELKDQMAEAQEIIDNMEEVLRERDKELLEKKKTLSEEKFAEEELNFRKSYQEYRVKSQNMQDVFTRQGLGKKREIMVEIEDAVEEFATLKKYDLVVPRSSVVYSSASIDISKEILEIVNKNLKNKASENKKGL
jgi:Skp family chaperone for outer membrane proteins